MSNVKIAKYIAILLGAGIVLCTYFVFLKILNKKTGISGAPVSAEMVLKVPENAEVKDIRITEGKIYFLMTSPQEENLIIVDENTRQEILKIVLKRRKPMSNDDSLDAFLTADMPADEKKKTKTQVWKMNLPSF